MRGIVEAVWSARPTAPGRRSAPSATPPNALHDRAGLRHTSEWRKIGVRKGATDQQHPSSRSDRMRQRHVDDMLRDEPRLQFIPADDVAHDQVIGAVVAALGGEPAIVRASFNTISWACSS